MRFSVDVCPRVCLSVIPVQPARFILFSIVTAIECRLYESERDDTPFECSVRTRTASEVGHRKLRPICFHFVLVAPCLATLAPLPVSQLKWCCVDVAFGSPVVYRVIALSLLWVLL
jgi:hypothetical protein